jgi:hypothetical protein
MQPTDDPLQRYDDRSDSSARGLRLSNALRISRARLVALRRRALVRLSQLLSLKRGRKAQGQNVTQRPDDVIWGHFQR